MTTLQEIEGILGRKINDEELHSVKDLNSFPPHLLAEAARLVSKDEPPLDPDEEAEGILAHGVSLRQSYLALLSDNRTRSDIKGFDEAIFEKGEDPAKWRRGGFLIPWFETQELATLRVDGILVPLQGANRPWVQVMPEMSSWHNYDGSCGAPAQQRDDLTYRTPGIPKTMRFKSLSPTMPIVDLSVAVRRYIATQVAQAARKAGTLGNAASPEALFHSIGVYAPSDDASIAVAALLAERTLPTGIDGSDVPGFRGPDAWYRR